MPRKAGFYWIHTYPWVKVGTTDRGNQYAFDKSNPNPPEVAQFTDDGSWYACGSDELLDYPYSGEGVGFDVIGDLLVPPVSEAQS